MEKIYQDILEHINSESKKNVDRANAILDLRRFFGSKSYSACLVGEHDDLYVQVLAFERVPQITWLSNNPNFDHFIQNHKTYTRHDVDSKGCLELFIRPHDVVFIQASVAANHPYPHRIISRFLNMARIKAYVLNSNVAFDINGISKDFRPTINEVEKMNADKFVRSKDIQRLNGWTEFTRKEPITNKNLDLL